MKLTKKLVNTGDSKSIRSKSRRFIKKKQQAAMNVIESPPRPKKRHKSI